MWVAQRLMPTTVLKWMAVPETLVPRLAPADRAELDEAIQRLFPVSARHDGMVYDARSQSGEFGMFPLERVRATVLHDLFVTEDLVQESWVKEWSVE